MAKINRPVLKQVSEMVDELLDNYIDKIDEAYCLHPDDDLDVKFSVKFKPAPEGQIKIHASMGFVESRVKDSKERLVDPQQRDLFNEAAA
jgi:hypothetical protein